MAMRRFGKNASIKIINLNMEKAHSGCQRRTNASIKNDKKIKFKLPICGKSFNIQLLSKTTINPLTTISLWISVLFLEKSVDLLYSIHKIVFTAIEFLSEL